jgi:hypothetical protein
MIVLSSAVRAHTDHNAIPSTHGATRRTLEEIDGVRPLLGDVQNAIALSDFFTAFP